MIPGSHRSAEPKPTGPHFKSIGIRGQGADNLLKFVLFRKSLEDLFELVLLAEYVLKAAEQEFLDLSCILEDFMLITPVEKVSCDG